MTRGKDIFAYSPSGSRVEDGVVLANYSHCSNSLGDVDTRARKLIDQWRFLQAYGIAEINHIAHSEAGVTTGRALEIIMEEGISDINLEGLVYVSVDSPHMGIDKPVLDWLGQHWIIPRAPDCLTRWTALPSMQFFDTQTGRYLLELWDKRDEATRERLDLLTK